MGIYTKKNLVDPHKPLAAWTLGGVLQKQLSEIKNNAPKGYTVLMNQDRKALATIQSYVEKKNYEFRGEGKSVALVNDFMRFLSKDERVLCMIVQNWKVTPKFGVQASGGEVNPTIGFDMPLDDYDSIFVFLSKGDKIFVFCVYDKDKSDLHKIVDSFTM